MALDADLWHALCMALRKELEPWMISTAVAAIKEGLPVKSVAGCIQVSYERFSRWLQEGADDACTDELKSQFASAVIAARSEQIKEGVRNLKSHAAVEYKAQLALLAAQDPETFGKQSTVKIDADVKTENVHRDLSALSDEELRAYQALEEKLSKHNR